MSEQLNESADILTRLERAHLMGCSDPADPTRRTTYGDAAEEIRTLRARLARVLDLADALAAWDLVDMPVPESVDVPDDYELGMNHAGAQLHAALSSPPEGSAS